MARVGLSLHWTGACRHPQCSTRIGASWRAADFPMHAAVIDRGGELTVVDPGYAPRFHKATEPFPDRLHRWATPATCPPHAALAAQLAREGRLGAVQRVVVTHFHADHIAGLADFPAAEVWCLRAAWDDFIRRRGLGAVRSGYLKALAPDDLAGRIRFIDDLPRRAPPLPLEAGFDLFGDGAVVLTPLPGHARGQVGALLDCEEGPRRLLIADAAWSLPGLAADQPPPWITRRLLGDPAAYRRTWDALRALMARDPDLRLIPAHCSAAAAREQAGGA